jgi:hypothetical protein
MMADTYNSDMQSPEAQIALQQAFARQLAGGTGGSNMTSNNSLAQVMAAYQMAQLAKGNRTIPPAETPPASDYAAG